MNDKLVYVFKFINGLYDSTKVSEFFTVDEANSFIATQEQPDSFYVIDMEIK